MWILSRKSIKSVDCAYFQIHYPTKQIIGCFTLCRNDHGKTRTYILTFTDNIRRWYKWYDSKYFCHIGPSQGFMKLCNELIKNECIYNIGIINNLILVLPNDILWLIKQNIILLYLILVYILFNL